jgi:hypothetical protein
MRSRRQRLLTSWAEELTVRLADPQSQVQLVIAALQPPAHAELAVPCARQALGHDVMGTQTRSHDHVA